MNSPAQIMEAGKVRKEKSREICRNNHQANTLMYFHINSGQNEAKKKKKTHIVWTWSFVCVCVSVLS